MYEDEITLCNRIFEKCQRQRWYAGDEHNTAWYRTSDRRYDYVYDEQGNRITIDNDPDDHPHKIGFAYPPASEETSPSLHAWWEQWLEEKPAIEP